MGNRKLFSMITAIVLLMTFICLGNSSILSSDSNQFGVCIRNCAQCKKMFGAYFEGQLCADACVKFKGKIIPDCEDLDSISPFLNKNVKYKRMSETEEDNSERITETETAIEETQDIETEQSREIEETATNQRGIDVSNWQGKIDWSKVAEAGIKHVCIKMTEGASFVDRSFLQNWKGAKEANIRVNCYHYFRALNSTPEQQMENIRKNSKDVGFDPAKNILAIDVEETGNEKATPVQMADNLNALLGLIKKDSELSRCPVMIYTSHGYWDLKVKWDKYNFDVYPLWVAHWETQNPRLPKPWKEWAWWQYSAKGKVDGITGNVDLDWVKV